MQSLPADGQGSNRVRKITTAFSPFMSMNSSEQQLKEMLQELQSRGKAQIISESVVLTIIQFVMLTGNLITLLVLALKPHMQAVPNMFVASLAISDFLPSRQLLPPARLAFQYCQHPNGLTVTLLVSSKGILRSLWLLRRRKLWL